jgi:hypothetical protein
VPLLYGPRQVANLVAPLATLDEPPPAELEVAADCRPLGTPVLHGWLEDGVKQRLIGFAHLRILTRRVQPSSMALVNCIRMARCGLGRLGMARREAESACKPPIKTG